MIIDCCPFFKELDVLELRLSELDSVVDKFVIVEAAKTQSLLDKPFYYEENKARFARFADKIIHIKLNHLPSNEGGLWTMENFQRNAIMNGLGEIPGLRENDIVMISDCDEIPSAGTIFDYLWNSYDTVAVAMSNHAFYANLLSPTGWVGTVITNVEALLTQQPQDLRNQKDSLPRVYGGWHLSYMGGPEYIYEKFHSCIEPLDKSKIVSYDEFLSEFHRKVRPNGSFLFSDKTDDSVPLLPFAVSDLPKEILRFPNLLWK